MIIKTRYRDISWEEARKCMRVLPKETARLQHRSWRLDLRGRSVSIIVPAVPACNQPCEGPFYRLADSPKETICPHIAEIGD